MESKLGSGKKWTHFWDIYSGGSQKLSWSHIFIEAPEPEAKLIFQNRFGRNPDRVTCTCCGPDYSISECKSLEDATAYHRGCEFNRETGQWEEKGGPKVYRPYLTLADYLKNSDVLVIRENQIKSDEREGSLREEGWVWK